MADIRKVARRLKRIPSGTILRLGGMTDCFQPTERVYHATREAIRIMNDRGIGYLIVTKSALVAADEYLALLDPRLAHIQVSISTTSDTLAQTYERASLPSARIAVIEKLAAQGFDVAVRLSPFIPQYNDFAILNAIRCRKILVEFLRVNT